MNEKLDNLFRFRDNEKFKRFSNIFTIMVLLYVLVVLGLICGFAGQEIHKAWAFSAIPLLVLVSFFKKNDYLFILAEFFTVIADIFLMLLRDRSIGFPLYIVVQLTYALYFYIRDLNKKRQIIITIIRPIAMGLAVLIFYLVMPKKFDYKMVLGILYYVNILINVVCVILLKDAVLIVGFSVFAFSDLFIGLGMVAKSGSAFKNFLNSFNFVHFFYLISQSILVFNKYKNDYFIKHYNK